MFLIASDVVINIDNVEIIHVKKGQLCCEVNSGTYTLENIPANALQQVAGALAEGKQYLELEDAKLVRGES